MTKIKQLGLFMGIGLMMTVGDNGSGRGTGRDSGCRKGRSITTLVR